MWDAEAGVFFSESDISGLHIEAETLEEFEAAMLEIAPEIVLSNHVSIDEIRGPHPEDAIPTIVFDRSRDREPRLA